VAAPAYRRCRREGDPVEAIGGYEVLSSYVLSDTDLREVTQRSLAAGGYRAVRVGPLKGRALLVEHLSEDIDRLDALMATLDRGAYRIKPRRPVVSKVAPPTQKMEHMSRWRSVW
jgi:hypothetical protein